jgi:predicted amidohydrolase
MSPARQLKIGVVQFAVEATLRENMEKFCAFIRQAAAEGCRLVVFPEGALQGPPPTPPADFDDAIEKVVATAAANDISMVFGLLYRRFPEEPLYNRLIGCDRTGRVVLAYDKLWNDTRFNEVPRAFTLEGVTCSAAICADRWIRAVEELPVTEGARLLIEVSNNYADEWIPDLGWYWYVPRAIRNQAFVVFCNSARESRGRRASGHGPGHGHSAIFAPDGRMIVGAGEESDRLLPAEIDCAEATALEAVRRHQHPVMRPFWDAGAILLRGGSIQVEGFNPPTAREREASVAAAQIAVTRSVDANLEAIAAGTTEAAQRGAGIVAFPELAVTGTIASDIRNFTGADLEAAIAGVAAAARRNRIAVAFGVPTPSEGGRPYNSAYVIDASGEAIARYDQLVVDDVMFRPGLSTQAMWLSLDGIPGIVTIGSDARWSELSELAAMRGAGIHLHLANAGGGPGDDLMRRQFFVTLASFYTLTVTVNAADNVGVEDASTPGTGGSVIWQDFRPTINHRREYQGRSRFCAIPLAQAGRGPELLVAAHTIPPLNLAHKAMVDTTVPGMRAWYDAGVRAIHSGGPAAAR